MSVRRVQIEIFNKVAFKNIVVCLSICIPNQVHHLLKKRINIVFFCLKLNKQLNESDSYKRMSLVKGGRRSFMNICKMYVVQNIRTFPPCQSSFAT